jgi:hypothetical protein
LPEKLASTIPDIVAKYIVDFIGTLLKSIRECAEVRINWT